MRAGDANRWGEEMLAWFHCPAGASGDMLLGSLLDAGAPLGAVRSAVEGIGVDGIRVATRSVSRRGMAATKVDVRVPRPATPRTWPDVRELLDGARLPGPVRAAAHDVFARLASAEAAVHGTDPEEVHFHEVGAADALADVVGTCAALHALDVTEVRCSAVALGTGMVHAGHGPVPVPAPAVLELLRLARAPVHTTEVAGELCTPTGAALLAGSVHAWGGLPPVRIGATGAGAGTRDLDELPNVVRVVLGEPATDPQARDPQPPDPDMLLLQANVDDLDPRVWPAVLERLLAAGAADAWLAPILMKKGRPAHTLSVLVEGRAADAVREVVFTETTTLGVREQPVRRSMLDRETRTVHVEGWPIRVKVGYLRGAVCNLQPEYEDVARAASQLGRPVRDVLAEATRAAGDGLR